MLIPEKKIAFYLMNPKGHYVLKQFIKKFGAAPIEYIASRPDQQLHNDYYNEIRTIAQENDIAFFSHHKEYEEIEKKFMGYKFAIGWRWLIKNTSNLIIFHDSLLPKYRGFAPLVNCLIQRENKSGVTALFATDEYDAGDIVNQKSFTIEYPITIAQAINQIAPLYFDLVSELFEQIRTNQPLTASPQDQSQATFSLWLDNNDYFIDWKSWSAEQIKLFVDAVGEPYAGASSYIANEEVKLLAVTPVCDVMVINRERHLGKVIFMHDNYPVIICKQGLLKITNLRDLKGDEKKISFRTRFQ
jgi:methionyl-tRNA formyltransferase